MIQGAIACRYLLPVAVLFAGFACSDNRDVCDNYPNQSCVALLLVSDQPLTIDEVRVTPLLGFSGGGRSSSFPAAKLPVTFALLPGDGETGPFRINVSGYQSAVRQGFALVNGQITAKVHSRIRVELISDQVLSDGGVDASGIDSAVADFSSADRSVGIVDGGATWTRLGVNTQSWITSIWGGDADHVIAGGDNLTLRSINHGSSWTQENPGLGWITGIGGSSAANVLTTTWNGGIYATDNGGVSWAPTTVPVSGNIYGVFSFGATNAFAVGQSGVLLQSTNGGQKWTRIQLGIGNSLNSVWGSSPDNLFIGGDGVLLRSQNSGADTSSFPIGATSVTKIWGTDADHVFALITDDTDTQLLNFDGNGWQTMFTFYGFYASSLWGTSANNFYVVGNSSNRGRIFHWSGAAWTEDLLPPNTPLLIDVYGFADNDIYVVGESYIHHFP